MARYPFRFPRLAAMGCIFMVITMVSPSVVIAEHRPARIIAAESPSGPRPVTALILGLLIPGCGHAYVGRPATGLVIFMLCVGNCLGVALVSALLVSLFPMAGFGLLTAMVIHGCLMLFDGGRSALHALRLRQSPRDAPPPLPERQPIPREWVGFDLVPSSR